MYGTTNFAEFEVPMECHFSVSSFASLTKVRERKRQSILQISSDGEVSSRRIIKNRTHADITSLVSVFVGRQMPIQSDFTVNVESEVNAFRRIIGSANFYVHTQMEFDSRIPDGEVNFSISTNMRVQHNAVRKLELNYHILSDSTVIVRPIVSFESQFDIETQMETDVARTIQFISNMEINVETAIEERLVRNVESIFDVTSTLSIEKQRSILSGIKDVLASFHMNAIPMRERNLKPAFRSPYGTKRYAELRKYDYIDLEITTSMDVSAYRTINSHSSFEIDVFSNLESKMNRNNASIFDIVSDLDTTISRNTGDSYIFNIISTSDISNKLIRSVYTDMSVFVNMSTRAAIPAGEINFDVVVNLKADQRRVISRNIKDKNIYVGLDAYLKRHISSDLDYLITLSSSLVGNMVMTREADLNIDSTATINKIRNILGSSVFDVEGNVRFVQGLAIIDSILLLGDRQISIDLKGTSVPDLKMDGNRIMEEILKGEV